MIVVNLPIYGWVLLPWRQILTSLCLGFSAASTILRFCYKPGWKSCSNFPFSGFPAGQAESPVLTLSLLHVIVQSHRDIQLSLCPSPFPWLCCDPSPGDIWASWGWNLPSLIQQSECLLTLLLNESWFSFPSAPLLFHTASGIILFILLCHCYIF